MNTFKWFKYDFKCSFQGLRAVTDIGMFTWWLFLDCLEFDNLASCETIAGHIDFDASKMHPDESVLTALCQPFYDRRVAEIAAANGYQKVDEGQVVVQRYVLLHILNDLRAKNDLRPLSVDELNDVLEAKL